MLAWMSNNTKYKVWDEITHPLSNFYGAAMLIHVNKNGTLVIKITNIILTGQSYHGHASASDKKQH